MFTFFEVIDQENWIVSVFVLSKNFHPQHLYNISIRPHIYIICTALRQPQPSIKPQNHDCCSNSALIIKIMLNLVWIPRILK